MSSEIGLNDVKPGMWVEFDDADGHYAGELHEMKNPESMVDVLIMSMGHKPPLYIETEDEGNLVVFLDFGDGYSTGSARNVHVYESKPETESVKQAEDDDKKPFWKGKTCGELEGLRVKITWNNGDTMTSTLDMVGNVAHCVSLSPAIRSSSTFVPYSGIKSIELVDDAFRERITDITKVMVKDTVVLKSGNRYTAVDVRPYCENGQTLYLRAEEFGALDGWWAYDEDFQYAVHRTFDKFGWPLRTGFYKDNAKQVWYFDAKQNNLMRMFTDGGSPAQSTQSPVYDYGRFKRLADEQNLWPLAETSLVVEAS